MKYTLEVYRTNKGKFPFIDWLNDLDLQIRQKIRMRLDRLSLGNFGNCEPIGEGASEIKFAGTKRTQKKDIEKSKEFLKEFKMKK